jgi:hypothetical protein
VLSIPPEQIDTTTQALAFVGKQLAQVTLSGLLTTRSFYRIVDRFGHRLDTG